MMGEHVQNLRSMGDNLRNQGQDGTARLVDMAADRLNTFSTYLTTTDGDRIVHDIEDAARNQPLLTASLGLVAGVTAARLLKAGASHRYRTYGSPESSYGSTGATDYSTPGRYATSESSYGGPSEAEQYGVR